MILALKERAEAACLPHMMHLALTKLYDEGYEARLDARGYLNNAIKKIVMADINGANLTARYADEMAVELMRDTDFDSARLALLSVAYFVIKLADEQLHPDTTCQSLLTALMLVADADQDENPELHAMVPMAKAKAGTMLSKALSRGMFNVTQVTPN